MKYLRQFVVIMCITFIGELLKYIIPLPIPSSIYGMVILFAGLVTGLIPLDAVKDTGEFLVEIMPVMFIPAGVGLITVWGVLKPLLLPVAVITVLSLITVAVASGRVSQWIIRKDRRKKTNE